MKFDIKYGKLSVSDDNKMGFFNMKEQLSCYFRDIEIFVIQ